MDSRLLGTWEPEINETHVKVRLHFLESGDLTLTISVLNEVSQSVKMTWSVEGNVLRMREASRPTEDRLEYVVERDGRLIVR